MILIPVANIVALRLWGVHTMATVLSNDFKGNGWTELRISFPTLEGRYWELSLAHQGEVEAASDQQVSIVYDPHKPTNARLASDLGAGTLASETFEATLSMLANSDTDTELGGIPLGLVSLLFASRAIGVDIPLVVYQLARLRRIARGRPAGPIPMQMRISAGHGQPYASLTSATGASDMLYVPLLASPAIEELSGKESAVDVFGEVTGRRKALVIRLPDGRLLWSVLGARAARRGGAIDHGYKEESGC
jgi:hypothetical protein